MIARATITDGAIIIRHNTDAAAFTYDPFTRTAQGIFANAILKAKPLITDADWTISADGTASMVATLDACAWISRGNTHVTIAIVAVFTKT